MNIEIILYRLCGGLLSRLLHGFIDLSISGYPVIVILRNIALILIITSVLRIVLRIPLALIIVPILGIILSIILIIPLTLIVASVLGVTLIITLIPAILVILHRVLRRDIASGRVEPMIVFFLLLRCQRLMEHFQFHCLNNVFSLAKPEDQFITFLYASGCQSDSMIQIGQFICPFFPIVSLLEFLQNSNSFFQTHILRLIQFILQNVPSRILGRHLYKFLIIFYCLHIFFHFNGKLAQRIADGPSAGTTFICQKQHISGILISAIDLIEVADRTQHHDTFYTTPVNRVGNFSRLCIFSPADQVFDFFRS